MGLITGGRVNAFYSQTHTQIDFRFRFFLARPNSLLFFSLLLTSICSFSQALKPVRPVWDGPFDIRMVGAPGLMPVFINASRAANGELLADSIIRQNVIIRSGKILGVNNQYKEFGTTQNIPPSAFLCDPSDPGCVLGLPTSSGNGCVTRFGSPELKTMTVALTYPDFDNDLRTFSSSMARLTIPPCAEIETAYLYWAGMYGAGNKPIKLVPGPLNSYNGSGDVFNTGANLTYTSVKLKAPGEGNYLPVTGTNIVTEAGSKTYICRADVTDRITTAGDYWVADLQSYPTDGGGGSSSGWALVVVFRSPLSPPRTICLWDGFQTVLNEDRYTQLQITNLQAPNAGNFKSYVGFGILDADGIASRLAKDGTPLPSLGFKFKTDKSAEITYNPLIDQPEKPLYSDRGYPRTCNVAGDAYDASGSTCKVPASTTCMIRDAMASSRITSYNEVTGKNGEEIVRLPNGENNLVIDLHHVKLPEGAIGLGASSATINFTEASGGDDKNQLFLAYIAIERLQPKLEMNKSSNVNSTATNTQITYSLKIKNKGNDISLGGDVIRDTLDIATTFVANSIVTVPAGAATLTSNTTLPDGRQALEINISRKIPAGDSTTVTFKAQVKDYNSNINLWDVQCKRTITNIAWVAYKTISSGILTSRSNSDDCGIGAETRILIQDPLFGGSNATQDLGSFSAASFQDELVISHVQDVLVGAGISPANLGKFDIRDANLARVKSTDKFPTSGGSAVYYAVIDNPGAGVCQKTYKITFTFCSAPTLQVTPPAAQCGGTYDLSKAITAGTVSPSSATLSYWQDTTAIALGNSTVNVSGTYYVQPALNNCEGKFYAIKVLIDTLPNITVTNPTAVCAPTTVDITTSSVWTDAANSTPTVTYHNATPAATGNAITLTSAQAISAGGTYYIKAVSGTCSAEKPVVVTIDPVPTFTLAAVPAQCLGAVDLSTKVTGLTPSTSTLTYFNDSTKAAMAATVTTSGTYYVKATGPAPTSCETKYKYGKIDITISAVPTGAIAITNPQFCNSTTASNNKATITLTFTGNPPFDFSYKGTGTTGTKTVSNHNALTYTFDVSTAETFNIESLKETNGCTATSLGSTVTSSFFEDPIQSGTPALECDPANTASGPFKFRVVFTGDKGDVASYTMDAKDQNGALINGTFTGKIWTSEYVDESKKISLSFTDKNGCNPVVVTDLSRVCSRTTPDAGPDTTLCTTNLPKTFQGNGNAVIAGETFRWKDLNTPALLNPVEGDNNLVLPANTPQGTYRFEFSITNPVSGIATDEVEITVHKETATPTLLTGYTGTTAAAPYKMCSSTLNLPGVANPDPAPLAKNWWTVASGGSIPDKDSTATPLLDNVSTGVGSGTFFYKNGVCPVKSVEFYFEKVGEVTPALVAINGGKPLGEGKQYDAAIDSLQKMPNNTADTLCLGGAYRLSTAALKSDEIGTWSYVLPAGTSVAFGSGLNSPTQDLVVNGIGETQIKWSVKNSSPALANCPANELTVKLVVRDVPKDGSLNLASLCEGTDSTFAMNKSTSELQPVTYVWSDGTLGATRTGAATGLSSSYKFESLAGSTEAKFFVTPSNRCGAGKAIRDSVKIKLAPRMFLADAANPHDTINGPLVFCATSPLTGYKLDGIQPNVTTYSWYWDGNPVGLESDTSRVVFDNGGRWELDQSGVSNHTIRVELTNACSEIAKTVGIMPLVKDTTVQIIGPSVVNVSLSSDKVNNQFCIPDDQVIFSTQVTTNPAITFLTDYTFKLNNSTVLQGPSAIDTLAVPANTLKDGDIVSVELSPAPGQCIRTVGAANTVSMEGFAYPDSIIVPIGDTICHQKGEIKLTVARNATSKGNAYDKGSIVWYKDNVLLSPQPSTSTTADRFQISLNSASQTGKYLVKVTGSVCAHTSVTKDTIPAKIYEQPVVTLPTTMAVPYEPSSSYRMPAVITGLNKDTLSYKEYTPSIWLQDPTNINTLLMPEKEERTIPYVLQVRTGPEGKGCTAEGNISVIYYLPLNIPNAFSPNEDGKNETWVITGLGKYPNTHVKIFNRWGSSIYTDNDGYRVPWDGRSNGTLLASGTYYYVIELKGSPDDTDGVRTGSLTIVR